MYFRRIPIEFEKSIFFHNKQSLEQLRDTERLTQAREIKKGTRFKAIRKCIHTFKKKKTAQMVS